MHARELRLVQYPSLMWITPRTLSPILPRFTAFKSITTLSLHSFSAHHFNNLDTETIFGHFFPTVRKLDLDEPRTTAKALLRFLCNFRALDDLTISDPEWDYETGPPLAAEATTLPPLRGTLHFMRLHADSADFVSLLVGLPVAFQHVSLVSCQLPSASINLLLEQLSSNLKSLSLSSWFISELVRHSSPFPVNPQIQATVFPQSIFPPVRESRKSDFSQEWFRSRNPSVAYTPLWGQFRRPTYERLLWILTRSTLEILPIMSISKASGNWMLNYTELPQPTGVSTRPWLSYPPIILLP